MDQMWRGGGLDMQSFRKICSLIEEPLFAIILSLPNKAIHMNQIININGLQ